MAQLTGMHPDFYGKLCRHYLKNGETVLMGRPEEPLERDGSPVRELAFWLRDLRHGSSLTYQSLAQAAHYATSTMQAAAAGHRLPTLKVTMGFVAACGGDQEAWRAYWKRVKRALDVDSPDEPGRAVEPPWASSGTPSPLTGAELTGAEPTGAEPTGAELNGPSYPAAGDPAAPDGWYVESFSALLRMDKPSPEAVEHRVIVAVRAGVSELATSISVPRHPAEADGAHQLEAELLYGGSLELREQPYESYFRHFIALPRSLAAGERHEYQLLLRVPPGQQMAPHYVYVPFCRSDRFELRARFSVSRPPSAIWVLSGAPTAVIYERRTEHATIAPDRFGEVHVEFRDLQVGRGYGICWQE
jgi:hypothetical protein